MRFKPPAGVILVFFGSLPILSAFAQDRSLSGKGQAPGTDIGRCTLAAEVEGVASVTETAGGSGLGSRGRISRGVTVFFAAIVFAGFLAALRAAGLVPAAFFFAAAETVRVDRLVFAAARAVFLPAAVVVLRAAVALRAADFLPRLTALLALTRAFLPVRRFAACFAAVFADLRAGRLADFLPRAFDFAAIASPPSRYEQPTLGRCNDIINAVMPVPDSPDLGIAPPDPA